jgi:hypothetical protein
LEHISKFGNIKLSNIPLLNLRSKFFNHYHAVKSTEFADSMKKWKAGAGIGMPYFTWYSSPEELFTYLCQASIIGLECYVTGAVYLVLGRLGLLKDNIRFVKNPFSIPGRGGTAVKYYKQLPGLASDEITLPYLNPKLWADVQIFYTEFRNPLFHGMQFESSDPKDIIAVFELLADIYEWIDAWYDPELIFKGSSWSTKLKRT